MSKIKNIGLIECGAFTQSTQINHINNLTGYDIKKVFVTEKSYEGVFQSQYPQIEMVQDKSAILQDNTIDLVIVSAPKENDMNIVAEVLQSGKNVQIL